MIRQEGQLSAEEVAFIRAKRRQGFVDKAIALMMGRSPSDISRMMARVDLDVQEKRRTRSLIMGAWVASYDHKPTNLEEAVAKAINDERARQIKSPMPWDKQTILSKEMSFGLARVAIATYLQFQSVLAADDKPG